MSSFSTRSSLERSTWPNKLEYQLSLFCYVLGLSSFWRFPYLAYENGGAPFVYAFLLLYILVGIPLVFLEMAWGQYSNLAPLQAFRTVPVMQGIGVCMLFLSCAVLLYFGVVSYYILVYLASCFSNPIPWTTCDHSWNTRKCQEILNPNCASQGHLTYRQGEGYGIVENGEFIRKSVCNYTADGTHTSPAVEYWTKNLVNHDAVCNNLPDIDRILFGSTAQVLAPPIIIISVFLGVRFLSGVIAMAKHIQFTGKVAYLLSTIPFAVSVMLLVRCVTLDGAVNGIIYLFVPSDLMAFASPKLWKDAIGQVFITLLTSWGGLITWSSYNRFYNKYYVDASLLIGVAPILSILSTISVFGVIGHLGTMTLRPDLSKALSNVSGPMVPLVMYSEALSQMWGDDLPWSLVVFISMFLSSATAMFPCLECILSCISDSVKIFRKLILRIITTIFLLLISFGIYYGLPCLLQWTGLQMIEFFDTFSLPFCFIIIALAELLLLSYSFGFKLLGTNTKAMTRNACLKSHFWSVMWGGVSPLVLLGCLVYSIVGIIRGGVSSMAPRLYLPHNATNGWTLVAGSVMVGFVFLVLILVAIIRVMQSGGPCIGRLRNSFTPHMGTSPSNGGGDISHGNGELFLSDYTSHRERGGIEILIDEDIVTSV
ncbi:sodium- and chloride-dependent glycine transporter 2-like [Ciona intestinalis]